MIREARETEVDDVMRVLEGALLEIEPGKVRQAIARGDALVASENGHVRGALVLEGTHVAAVAVVRRHRANGIGSALVRRAAERGPLTTEFRPAVRPFYESLGFAVECEESGAGEESDGMDSEKRCRGRLPAQDSMS
ncbi:GNAT family N-acetyltransferase [Halalkalicoccus tibetensis]|uniref:GNAT family N-acetyltransferase n=1 Tax=Halalkalicoccus tibetensis TaxID=175632 RepID=A0ABD5V9A3_9EURY